MIITKQKSMPEIKSMLEPHKKLVIVGCGLCATLSQTGGEKEVKEMIEQLKDEKTILGSVVIESPCDLRVARRDLRSISKQVAEADAILALCCGAGVQAIADLTEKIVIPALDTCFLGEVEHIGRFYERCRMCGDCILYETGGICPIARCTKGLMNGPCGGVRLDGKCEVDPETDCAWVQIYQRLEKLGKLGIFSKIMEPKDWSRMKKPGKVEFDVVIKRQNGGITVENK